MINDDPNSIEAEISDIQLMAKEEKQGGLQEVFGQMSRPVLIMAIGLAIFNRLWVVIQYYTLHHQFLLR